MTWATRNLANLETSDAPSETDEPLSIIAVDPCADEAWEDDASDPVLAFLDDYEREQLLEIIQRAIALRAPARPHLRRCFRLHRVRAAGE